MFLEDEFVIRRLRARRVSISLLVAFVAFTASILMTFGLVTTVYAEESQQKVEQLAGLVRPNDVNSGSLLFPAKEPGFFVEAPRLAAGLIAQKSTSVNLPQTATRADEQILRGIVMLLTALIAASGLAIWRRRVRGIFAGAKS
ncbi:hypothetical protein FHT76_005588 [Rhizobium sp. BK176]|nr:hypothetical protein [Rhizobium sp. BK399]MCS3741440.1 hypothetical protein [Rhizobium sp. BK661]MCS4093892.1 hypothetical protein [Rhizobium sp. BK176]